MKMPSTHDYPDRSAWLTALTEGYGAKVACVLAELRKMHAAEPDFPFGIPPDWARATTPPSLPSLLRVEGTDPQPFNTGDAGAALSAIAQRLVVLDFTPRRLCHGVKATGNAMNYGIWVEAISENVAA